jgi:hypothetical protein
MLSLSRYMANAELRLADIDSTTKAAQLQQFIDSHWLVVIAGSNPDGRVSWQSIHSLDDRVERLIDRPDFKARVIAIYVDANVLLFFLYPLMRKPLENHANF